ncbi:transcription factor cwo isoform X2 [Planococcus citri]|uniref:transcription factor cwo isoform X2 n=1 Tax=Planococcus citri TaxID=170843 RepID=UPI0031F7C60A
MYINMECKHSYWEDSKPSINIEKNFNFSANVAGGVTSEEDDYHHTSPKRKIAVTRDPMSHRIIEKRRRDRMNNCLADLSRLIPAEYLKKGRGRIEKTEIIEMAIKHMKFLQDQTRRNKTETCEIKVDNEHQVMVTDTQYVNEAGAQDAEMVFRDDYKIGYQDCLAETMHFLVEVEGFYPSDALCVKLMSHLEKYFDKISHQEGKVVYRQLENPALPNTFEPKVNSYHSSSISVAKEHSLNECRPNSAPSVAHVDENSSNESVHGTSQLREMLVGPHLNSLYSTAIRPNIIRHSTPERGRLSSVESSHSDGSSSNGSLYKFKNYIKERFSAELSNLNYNIETSNVVTLREDKSPPSPIVVNGTKRKTEYINESDNSSVPSPLKEVKHIDHHYSIASKPVPIFALHAKGAFYIPLSIDSNLLTPFLTELNNDYGTINGFPPMVLHPVTISVNFNQPSSLLSKPSEFKALLSPTISHHSNTASLHVVPECR